MTLRKVVWLLIAAPLVLSACSKDSIENATDSLQTVSANIAETEATQWRAKEEAVQACMQQRGHEYNPRPLNGGQEATLWFIVPAVRGDGTYGITAGIPALVEDLNSSASDSNREIFVNLSDAEQHAWIQALGGSNTELDLASMVLLNAETGEPLNRSEARERSDGCLGEALREVGSIHPLEELGSETEELFVRIVSDPRLIQADQAWSACMSESGYDYISPFALFDSLQQEAVSVVLSGDDFDDLSSRERTLATADAQCRSNTSYSSALAPLEEALTEGLLNVLEP